MQPTHEQATHQPPPVEMELARAAHAYTRSPRVLSMHLERLDALDETTLRGLTQFPDSPKAALTQTPPSLPLSSYPELFTREALDYFRAAVTEQCGELDLQMHVARADIATVSGRILHNQPVHIFSSFAHQGERFAGSFFGSISNSVLAFGSPFSFEARREFIEALIEVFCATSEYRGVAIAFPQRMICTNSGALVPALRSAAYEILTGSRLQFTSFNALPPEAAYAHPDTRANQLFFFRGERNLLAEHSLLKKFITIRRVRTEQLDLLSREPDFNDKQLCRDRIREGFVHALFGEETP